MINNCNLKQCDNCVYFPNSKSQSPLHAPLRKMARQKYQRKREQKRTWDILISNLRLLRLLRLNVSHLLTEPLVNKSEKIKSSWTTCPIVARRVLCFFINFVNFLQINNSHRGRIYLS
jgi:hypothetical protein